jgi:hypothetical protein
MMYGDQNAPLIFSGETNPYMRQAASDGDSFSIFGKKLSKNKALEALKKLSGGLGGDDGEGEAKISQSLIPDGKSAKAPKYGAKDLYGGFFSMYGGQKVRGGLLGE